MTDYKIPTLNKEQMDALVESDRTTKFAEDLNKVARKYLDGLVKDGVEPDQAYSNAVAFIIGAEAQLLFNTMLDLSMFEIRKATAASYAALSALKDDADMESILTLSKQMTEIAERERPLDQLLNSRELLEESLRLLNEQIGIQEKAQQVVH
ncbi:MAG: hypothetical protein ACR2PH_12010 [Desulfobulbia bacterium]